MVTRTLKPFAKPMYVFNSQLETHMQYLLSLVSRNLGKSKDSIEHINDMLSISTRYNLATYSCRATYELGMAHIVDKEPHMAIEFFQEASRKAQALDDTLRYECVSQLALAYESVGDYQKAAKFHIESHNLSRLISQGWPSDAGDSKLPGTMEEESGFIIILNLLCISLRQLQEPYLRLICLDCMEKIGEKVDDSIRLQRIVPYVVALIDENAQFKKDKSPLVRAQAIRTLDTIFSLTKTLNVSDVSMFKDYILPVLKRLPNHESEPLVLQAYGSAIPSFAQSAKRLVEYAEMVKYSQSKLDINGTVCICPLISLIPRISCRQKSLISNLCSKKLVAIY